MAVVIAIGLGTLVPGLPARQSAALAGSAKSCPPANSFYTSVAKSPRRSPLAAGVSVQSRLSQAGELVGRTLVLSVAGGVVRQLDLAAESFASEAVANVVVFGQYEPQRGSTVRAWDLESGCEFSLLTSTDAVRSAVLAADLAGLFVHSVAAADRSDRGIRRVDLATGAIRPALPGLAAAEPFGATFSTTLQWSVEGADLAVQTCGIVACRTRVLATSNGTTQSFVDRPHGRLVGLTAENLFAFDVCHELPCPLEEIHRADGTVAALDVEALSASVSRTASGVVLVADTPAGPTEIRP